jgi:hypothetical protein
LDVALGVGVGCGVFASGVVAPSLLEAGLDVALGVGAGCGVFVSGDMEN